MASRTSGGLIKFSIALSEPLLREIERIKAESPRRKRSPLIEELLWRGVRDYDREQELLRHEAEKRAAGAA